MACNLRHFASENFAYVDARNNIISFRLFSFSYKYSVVFIVDIEKESIVFSAPPYNRGMCESRHV